VKDHRKVGDHPIGVFQEVVGGVVILEIGVPG
jgi:hypothetical protein